jgi:hypothetical protein
MSVNVPQFSIIGGTRNQGWVGQGVRSRTIPPTNMRGDTQKGNGGCCGTYYVAPLVKGLCTNNPDVIKPAVLSNYGMIRTQYRWIWRSRPYTSVKPGSGNILYRTSDEYTQRKAQTATCVNYQLPTVDNPESPICNNNPNPPICSNYTTNQPMFKNWLNTPQSFAQPYPNPTTKMAPSELGVANSQGEYMRSLDSCCTYLDVKFLHQENESKTSKTPFACGLSE